jgi:hypothetical protein
MARAPSVHLLLHVRLRVARELYGLFLRHWRSLSSARTIGARTVPVRARLRHGTLSLFPGIVRRADIGHAA